MQRKGPTGTSATAWRRLARHQRGTTIVEYVMILVVVLVVAGIAYRTLAGSVSKKLGVVTTATDGTGGGGGTAGAGGAGGASGESAGAADKSAHAGSDGYAAYDENGKPTGSRSAGEGDSSSMLARFGLLCVAVLGGAAAIFAIMKGKHAG